jgi:DNA modification methylase
MVRVKTKTSSFGTSKREGHDATQFYSSNLYTGLEIDKNVEIIDHSASLPKQLLNSESEFNLKNLEEIPDYSLHLIIWDLTWYEKNRIKSLDEFLESTDKVIPELHRFLCTGGKLVTIIDNKIPLSDNATTFYPLHAHITPQIISHGFLMRGETIWVQNENMDATMNISNLILSNLHSRYQHVLIFSKDSMKREKGDKTDSISRDQFLSYTKSIWKSESGKISSNLVIPHNCNDENSWIDLYNHVLQLYSFVDDYILYIIPKEKMKIRESVKELRKNAIFLMNQSS